MGGVFNHEQLGKENAMRVNIWWIRGNLHLTEDTTLHSAPTRGRVIVLVFISNPTMLSSGSLVKTMKFSRWAAKESWARRCETGVVI